MKSAMGDIAKHVLKNGLAMRSVFALFSSHPANLSVRQQQRQTSRPRIEGKSLSKALKRLRRHAVAISIASDETIFSEGDNAADAYIVIRGVARLCMTTLQCGRTISDFMLVNDPLGVIEQTSYAWTAEAATDLDLLRISKAQAGELLGDSGSEDGFASYAWQLAADAWRFQRALEEQSPIQRLACFLVRFSQRTNTPTGHPMNLPISHSDIACHLGLTADQVSQSFAALTRQRAIGTHDSGTCTILDSTALIGLVVQAMLPKSPRP